MSEDEAFWLYDYLGEHAAIDGEDGLSKDEAEAAFKTLEELEKQNDKRKEEGLRDLPFPPP